MSASDSPNTPTKIGRYKVLERIGSGGFGTVYKVTETNGTIRAIKVLRPELSDDPLLRQRLQREGEAIQAVKGQRTVHVHDVVTKGPHAYLVMELLEGPNLEQLVRDQGPMTGPLLWYVAEGLIQALDDIHGAGIVHRDLKPSNVIYGPDGVKVLDFGISSVADTTSLTNTGAFLGTAGWISPEQIANGDATSASDVFNLGLVIGFLASGKHIFGSGRSDAIMYRITHSEPDLSSIPSPTRELVERCLAKDPASRPTVTQLTAFIESSGLSWDAKDSTSTGVHPQKNSPATPTEIRGGSQSSKVDKTLAVGRRQQLPNHTAPSRATPSEATTKRPSISQAPRIAVGSALTAALILIAVVVFLGSRGNDGSNAEISPFTDGSQKDSVVTSEPVPSSIISYPPVTYGGFISQPVIAGPFPTEHDFNACDPQIFIQQFGAWSGVRVSCNGAWAGYSISDAIDQIFRWTDNGWVERGTVDLLGECEPDKLGMPRSISTLYWNVEYMGCDQPITTVPEDPTGPLQLGDIGERVRQLQVRLVEWNLLDDDVDGRFGPNTHNAVIDYQFLAELEPTGIVDERTAMALGLVEP